MDGEGVVAVRVNRAARRAAGDCNWTNVTLGAQYKLLQCPAAVSGDGEEHRRRASAGFRSSAHGLSEN